MPSQSLPVAFFLALSGGFFDAYTYVCRDGVFANAQTGNMVMLGISVAKLNLHASFLYLIPILAFVAGVFLSEVIKQKSSTAESFSKFILLLEVLILLGVAFIPQRLNMLANVLISFVCAMQMETFTKFENQVIATTVSTGNLRKAAEFVFKAVTEKNREDMKIAFMYILIIALFVFGVVFGTWASDLFGIRSVWIAAALLFIGIVIITRKTEYIPESAA